MERRGFENKAFLIGRLESSFDFAYVEGNEKIYSSVLLITRTSGIVDRIPVTMPENKLARMRFLPDLTMYKFKVEGYLVTNLIGNSHRISVRVTEYSWEMNYVSDLNRLELTGIIYNKPRLRNTPKGRIICDFILLTQNECGRKVFVHSIAWEKYAYLMNNLKAGNKVSIVARFQSRKYKKIFENGQEEEREIYEASTLSVEL